ncbi:MAG: restriction endonuclease subunit S [Acidobacteriota bacterium]|nr:restriction endonuclease subunit S [Acidobacteriota bacterium]
MHIITKGTTPTSIGLSFSDSGIPFLRVQNLRNHHLDLTVDPQFISESTNRALARSIILRGDVLLSIAGTIGRTAIVPNDCPTMNCNQAIAIIRPRDTLDARYLMHWLEAEDARQQIASFKVTATISNLSLSQIASMSILLPPLPEQQRIAAILDQAEALQAKRRQALAKLDTLTQSLFLEMFGDPATSPASSFQPLGGFIDAMDTINYGVVQPGEHYQSGLPLIRVGDFSNGVISHDNLKLIHPDIEAAYRRSRIRGTEILLSCVGSIGTVALCSERMKGMNVARAVARIPADAKKINRLFLLYYLRTSFVQNYFLTQLRTVNQPTLNIKQIIETPTLSPPQELQKRFASAAMYLDGMKDHLRRAARETTGLHRILQQKAFRGEL